jgi:hypothetical protein
MSADPGSFDHRESFNKGWANLWTIVKAVGVSEVDISRGILKTSDVKDGQVLAIESQMLHAFPQAIQASA